MYKTQKNHPPPPSLTLPLYSPTVRGISLSVAQKQLVRKWRVTLPKTLLAGVA